MNARCFLLILILAFVALPLQAQEDEEQVSRMEFRTYIERSGSVREYETEIVEVDIKGSMLELVGRFPSGNPQESEFQDLTITISDFRGRGTYDIDGGLATWQNLAGKTGKCNSLTGSLTVFSHDPATGIDGSFSFRCATVFNSGVATFTRIHGRFIKGLEPKILTPGKGDTVESFVPATIEWSLPGRDLVDIYVVYEPDPLRPEILQYPVAENVDASLGSYTWEIPDSMSPQAYLLVFDDLDPETPIVSEEFVMRAPWLARVAISSEGECVGCPYYEMYSPSRHAFSHGNFPQNFDPRIRPDFPERYNYNGADDPFSPHPYDFNRYVPSSTNYAHSRSYPEWENWVRAYGVSQCYISATRDETLPRSDVVRLWAWYTGHWNGSCFGLSMGSAMAFYDPAGFVEAFGSSVTPGSAEILTSVPLTNALRDDVATLFSHQYGKEFQDTYESSQVGVFEFHAEMSRILLEDASKRDMDDNVLIGISDGGGHALTAFGLAQDENDEDIWYLFVYDSNFPEDDERFMLLNLDLGLWSYSMSNSRLWTGGELIIADRLSNYFGTPEIEDDPIFADMKTAFRYGIGVQASSATGTYSLTPDGTFASTGEGTQPLYSLAGPGRPYAVRTGETSEWTADLRPNHDSGVGMMIETPTHLLSFYSDADPDKTDHLRFDKSSITAFNPDSETRRVEFDVVYRLDNSTRTLTLYDITLGTGDSIRFSLLDDDVGVDNFGAGTSYRIGILQQGSDGEKEGEYTPVDIGAGSRHRIDPPWWNIGTRLPIYVADGEGSESDTIIRINSLLGVDRDRLVEGPVRITNPIGDLGSLQLDLKRPGVVRIDVFDGLGRTAGTLFEGMQRRGSSTIPIDASGLAPGVWMLRVSLDGNVVATERVVRIE